MNDSQCVAFLQRSLPRLRLRWPGFRKVRRQVCKRIGRRIAELGVADLGEYSGYLEAHPAEWSVLDSFCRIPISRFYRDRGVFDLLGREILPELAGRATARNDTEARCWSAGCASGEEVYTLKIVWHERVLVRFPKLPLRIIATDVDGNLLQRARRGCYAPGSLKDLPEEFWTVAFTRSGDVHCVRSEFRDRIDFELQDIREQMPDGPFHLILCRHLAFTYFDEELQRAMLARMIEQLLPGGVLVTGKQEPLPPGEWGLSAFGPRLGVYTKNDR